MTLFEIIPGIFFFIPAIFLAFYIPGRVILRNLSFEPLLKIAISIVIGIVLWAFQGLIFGYLHLRWLSYVYLIMFLVFFIKFEYYKFKSNISLGKIDLVSLFLIIVGAIGQTFPYWRMGLQTSQGIILSAHNLDDHVWHAALIKELIKRFPPNEPAISGVVLKDYHYFYNLVTAELIRVFHLPFFTTQFTGMYMLAPILLGIVAYYLAKIIWPSRTFIRLFLFFIYFGGNAAGWIMLIMNHTFNWSLSSLINDSSKFMDSPPYGYAIVLGLTGLYLLVKFKQKLPVNVTFVCALIFGSLLEFKVYVGIPFLISLGAYSLVSMFKSRIEPFIIFVSSAILAFALLKLGSSSSSGLIFLPVDIPRDFINQPLLGLKDWQFRWIIYQNHHSIFRLIQYGAMMSGLYLLIQFGIQLLGLFTFPITIRKLNLRYAMFLYAGITSAFILGLFFYQTVGGANIWEFFLASVPFLSILTSLTIAHLIENKLAPIRFLILFIIIIIVIPQWLISMRTYIYGEYLSGFHGIPSQQALSFKYISEKTPLRSLIFIANNGNSYSYASIANLFMNRDLYLSGNGVRQIITPEISKRREEVAIITLSNDKKTINSILQKENILYLYYYGEAKNSQGLKDLKIVFANSAATIFQVR